ncbi:MAG: ankyrin repeat domain-containing protein [Bellilinea sp.]|jgi:ankyrin repeat protein
MIPIETFFNLVQSGDLAQVKAALDADAELAHARALDGLSALMMAVYYRQPAIARLLLKYGAQPNLHEACALGLVETVETLLAAQPDQVNPDQVGVNAFAPDGFQPLGLASFFGHLAVVESLLARGVQVDSPSRNPMKVMPLHSACAGGHVDIVRALIAHGAPVNARQAEGFTPLHSAAQNGDLEIIRLLLDAGADPLAADDEGQTPLALAEKANQAQAAALLRPLTATRPGLSQ